MWFGGQRIRQQMKKKNSFDLIQIGFVHALPAAIGKSHKGKPGPRCLWLGAERCGAGPVVALSCSVGCYILLSEVSCPGAWRTSAPTGAPGHPSPHHAAGSISSFLDRFITIQVALATTLCTKGQASFV